MEIQSGARRGGGVEREDCQLLMSFLNPFIVHSSTQENSNDSCVGSLCCGFCHSQGVLMKERLKLRSLTQLLPLM